jgi:hypothetical protein
MVDREFSFVSSMADIDKQRFPPNVTTLPMTDLARLQALNPKTL